MQVRFRREGPPVVYIKVPYWTRQASNCVRTCNDNPRKYSDRKIVQMYGKVGK